MTIAFKILDSGMLDCPEILWTGNVPISIEYDDGTAITQDHILRISKWGIQVSSTALTNTGSKLIGTLDLTGDTIARIFAEQRIERLGFLFTLVNADTSTLIAYGVEDIYSVSIPEYSTSSSSSSSSYSTESSRSSVSTQSSTSDLMTDGIPSTSSLSIYSVSSISSSSYDVPSTSSLSSDNDESSSSVDELPLSVFVTNIDGSPAPAEGEYTFNQALSDSYGIWILSLEDSDGTWCVYWQWDNRWTITLLGVANYWQGSETRSTPSGTYTAIGEGSGTVSVSTGT